MPRHYVPCAGEFVRISFNRTTPLPITRKSDRCAQRGAGMGLGISEVVAANLMGTDGGINPPLQKTTGLKTGHDKKGGFQRSECRWQAPLLVGQARGTKACHSGSV